MYETDIPINLSQNEYEYDEIYNAIYFDWNVIYLLLC